MRTYGTLRTAESDNRIVKNVSEIDKAAIGGTAL